MPFFLRLAFADSLRYESGMSIPPRKISLSLFLVFLSLATVFAGGLSGCAAARTDALERRQGRMNTRTDYRAERRAIRSENMDARSQALFDAM